MTTSAPDPDSGAHPDSGAATEPGATAGQSSAPHGAARRLATIVLVLLIVAAPAALASLVWSTDAASPVILGGIVGLVAAVSAGRRIALIEVFLLLLAAPLAVVSGQVPIAGAALMALLCLGAGLTAMWGLHGSFKMIPLVLAYPMIQPPALGDIAPVRDSTVYLVTLSLLLFGGALWMALIVPVLARRRELPQLQPAARVDTLTYTTIITVLCSVNTFAVLTINPSSEGAWLILTLIAVTQLGPLKSMKRTVLRVIGTVLGAGIAAGIATAAPGSGGQQVLALVCLGLAMYYRTAAYWVYVAFLTPTVVLLSATGNVDATTESRVVYTVIGASQVLLASAIVLVYQHLRSSGRAQATDLQADVMTPAGDAD